MNYIEELKSLESLIDMTANQRSVVVKILEKGVVESLILSDVLEMNRCLKELRISSNKIIALVSKIENSIKEKMGIV